MNTKFKNWQYWKEEWIKPLVVAVILAVIIRHFVIQPFKIPSTSMYPALKVGDRIFVNKFIYGAKIPFTDKDLPKLRDPKRGDIIVFISVTDGAYPDPENEYIRILGPVFFNKSTKGIRWYTPRYIVKRLIGLPNDEVRIKGGNIYINDKLLDDPLIIEKIDYLNAGDYGKAGESITVPPDSYFALGDNSPNSIDSRFWGFIPDKSIIGKVFVIWWPLNRIRIER